ncbi:MAG: hypothetical protein H7Z41_13085 [Cytophagales bacterium]|nr:hypothetical protein [Armatimonadota bacterium]
MASRIVGFIASALLLGVTGGCGSGISSGGQQDGSTALTTIRGRLQAGDDHFSDGHRVDFYICTARRGGVAQVEMNSAQLDAVLIVGITMDSGLVKTIAEDDNSGGGRDARVTFPVTSGERYYLAATHAPTGGPVAAATGDYALTPSDILQDTRPTSDIVPRSQAVPLSRTFGKSR